MVRDVSERGERLRSQWLRMQEQADTCMYEDCKDAQETSVFDFRVMMDIRICEYHYLMSHFDNETDRNLNAKSLFDREWEKIKEEHNGVEARV